MSVTSKKLVVELIVVEAWTRLRQSVTLLS